MTELHPSRLVTFTRQALCALTLVGGLMAARGEAQVLYGSITGAVKDPSDAAIPGATVTATQKETNLSREATTNAEGLYSFTNVPAGTYTVKVALTGFREYQKTAVPVNAGEIARVDVKLEVGELTESVTVQSEARLLQTDKADVSTQLKSAEITALPLNQFRNYQALINLVPGATPAAFQNTEYFTPARSLSVSVNGQNHNNNGTRTDGATNLNIWLPHHTMYVSPAETVETVTVSTNNFDAEQGMAGGAAITVITKSGTNQFKGSAFEFYNSEKLSARPYFFGNDPAGIPAKLPVDRNIFGGTLGGPIKRNRLFFFGSYEGFKRTQSLFNFFTVPNAALRNGDFSGATNANGSVQVIYDPLTGNPDGSGRVPFPNNVIPTSRIHAIARQLLGFYPLPNSGGTGAGSLTNNYQREERRTFDRHNYDAKVNFNRTAAHQLWGKVSYMDAVVDDLTFFLGPDPNAKGDGGLTKVHQFTTGQTWTVGSTLVWDATFGFSRQNRDVLGPDFQAGNFGLDILRIPGTNDQGTGDARYSGYPHFATGFSALGNSTPSLPSFSDERTFSLATNVTKVMGRHDLRAGYLGNFLYLTHWVPEQANPRGSFSFAGNATALPGTGAQTANFYNTYAAFLLGLVGTAAKSVQHEEMTTREWQHGLFVRDRFQVSPKLTLDLGLRWEYYPIMHRADRGLERVDLATLDVLLGGRGGNPKKVGLEASKDNFAPRLGLIYRIDDNTVTRAGYGVTYNSGPWGRPLKGFYPATIGASFFQNEPFSYYTTLDKGIPLITGPDLNSGRFPLPPAVDMRTPEPGNVDRGTIQSYNVAFERRLPWDIAVDVAYVGARGDGGFADLDINAPLTLGGGNNSRPMASLGRFRDLKSWGQRLNTRYNSLQVAINRPFIKGLLLKGAYTLSKAKNMTDEDGWTGLSWNTPSELHRNFATAGYDRTHNFQMGFLYELPWKRDGGYGNVAKALISDWQANGVFGAFSGTPFTVGASGTALNTPSNAQTADLVGDVKHIGAIGASGTYYDPAAWRQPTGVRFGDTARNQFRGPGGINLDFSVFRSFPMRGAQRLEFRGEAFNLTNTPKFGNPRTDITDASFMRVLGTLNAYGERQFRLGLRFAF
jgi:hypothetical protein